jgi:hypothetical protein
VAAGDFNADGAADLATADYWDHTVSVLLGHGDGTFAARTAHAVGNRPRSVAAHDFNADWAVDLVTTDEDDDTVSVLLGNGDGTFAVPEAFAVGGEPHSVAAHDFNADGMPDLVTADYGDDTVSVLLNLLKTTTKVISHHVFYNNSYWDTPTADNPQFNDDTAIAPHKWALEPGSAATFDNYTGYSRGINGIIVDIANPAGTITDADFQFNVGNDNHPANWDPFLVAPTVTVRSDKGLGGSDRVTLIWPDNTIQNTWLQVTVLANGNTGLAKNHVFYFGNAVADVGDQPTISAKVDALDILYTRNNPHPFFDPVEINDPADFDRDARVDALDILIARNNQTTFFNELNLIDLGEKGDRSDLCEAPCGPSRQIGPVPFFPSDAVFTKPPPLVAPATPPQSAKLAWLYELEQSGTRQRPSERHLWAATNLDRLWAMD